MKKYIALLTALSILAANGTTAVSAVSETSDGNSETVSVSESEKKECLVSIILTDIYKYNSDFLDYYQKTLEADGMTADESQKIRENLNVQFNKFFKLEDNELESERKKFISEETNKDIDNYLTQIGIDKNETEIASDSVLNGYRFRIKVSLTDKQIETAEKLKGCQSLVTVEEEIGKYKGKIGNVTLLNAVRAGNDRYGVSIQIKTDFNPVEVTESDCIGFVEKILAPVGVKTIEGVDRLRSDIIYLYACTDISSEQLINICEIENVTRVYGTDGRPPMAIPTEEPTSEPTSIPSAMPTFAPDFEPETGDVNCDFTIDVTDLSELSLALIGDRKLSEAQQKAADVDKDGKVTLSDLARMRQYLSKVITSFG